MSAEEMTQERLVGASPDANIVIETTGRVIRPAFELPGALVDELRLHASANELWMTAVDPANVGFIDLTIHEAAFSAYDAPSEFTTGLPLDTLQSQLRGARMGTKTSDPVELDVDTTRTRLEIEREYSTTTLERVDGFLNIDPDSIRQEPDIPDDLGYQWKATVDAHAFKDAVEHLNAIGDHMRITESEGDIELDVLAGSKSDPERAGLVTITGAAERQVDDADSGVSSTFSLDYVLDMARALKKADVDAIQMEFGDKLPIRFAFERTDDDGEVLYDGEYALAPRIGAEDKP